ncbi:hypothetical protein LTR56_012600 [Elasticomyces elasticus]|nr:hypothetical protein LTR22_018475 [Elasticomyces elasticus]KAK3639240.1 hypothetical protein LTR56_012600 [Elasticomyces elasticus]KAK4912544.1 hypothetical protein LTR49_019011 [Elasticomyces elasticus]KAK5751914.1 hypothetical protein LTS12_018020 [Elasticomyces elasticus]
MATSTTDHVEGLLGLPQELLTDILRFVPNPTDMINVCAVCKAMQVVALPLLYHDVHLDLLDAKPTKATSGLLSSTNPGLALIRNLTINEEQGDSDAMVGECCYMALLVLSVIPRDTLRSFSSNIYYQRQILDDLNSILIQHQSLLETIRVSMFSSADFFENSCRFQHAGVDRLRHIECSPWETIDITSHRPPSLGLYCTVRPKLETLDLVLRSMGVESDEYTSDDEMATATSLFFQRFIRPTQEATRGTQQGIYNTSERPFPALRRLGLQHALMGGPAASMLCRAFSITQLTSLTLQYCSDIVPLLKLLVSNQGLLLEHLVIMAEDTGTTPGLSMKELLDSLLGGFGSLQTLVLNINQFEVPPLETNRMPSVWAIGQHSATLKVLSLDFDDERYDLVHFRILGRLLIMLEQLSSVFPPVPLWRDLREPHALGDMRDCPWAACMREVAALPRLITLHVRRLPRTTWLQCHLDVGNTDPRNNVTTTDMLQRLSTKCFKNVFYSKPLKVVAWGSLASFIPGELNPLPHVQPPLLDGTHDCDSWSGMQVFTRCEKRDLVGGIDVIASVPKGRLKYYEPAVEVLDVIEPVDGFLRFE